MPRSSDPIITVRMPVDLRDEMARNAKLGGETVNGWMIRAARVRLALPEPAPRPVIRGGVGAADCAHAGTAVVDGRRHCSSCFTLV